MGAGDRVMQYTFADGSGPASQDDYGECYVDAGNRLNLREEGTPIGRTVNTSELQNCTNKLPGAYFQVTNEGNYLTFALAHFNFFFFWSI